MKMQQVQQQNATVGFVYHTLNKRGRVYFDGLYYTGETLTAAGQWLCKAYSSRELAIFQVDRVQP